jgi:2-keto-4-pentenoate hydratase
MILTDQQIEEASQLFIARRRNALTGPALPPSCRPTDIDDALHIQQRVLQLLGAQVGGWKSSVPPPGGAILAPIPHDRIFRTSPCSMPLIDGLAAVEPEIAYVMAADLPPRATAYSPEDVLQAVASTHLAFELIVTRYAPQTALELPDKLADSLSNYGLFLGPAIAAEYAKENIDGQTLPAFRLTLSNGSQELGQWNGKHPDGHPLRALHWLANDLSTRNTGLRRGDVVTTGSYHGLIHLPVAQPLRMSFGSLGEIAIEMQAA